MQSTAILEPAGSLVADHCHTYTSQRFYYRASYRCEGAKILWQASVRLGHEQVEELRGVSGIGEYSSVIAAVKNAVEAAIDRHAFLESEWGGLSGLSALAAPALRHSAAHG
jgi:hypothetical protein